MEGFTRRLITPGAEDGAVNTSQGAGCSGSTLTAIGTDAPLDVIWTVSAAGSLPSVPYVNVTPGTLVVRVGGVTAFAVLSARKTASSVGRLLLGRMVSEVHIAPESGTSILFALESCVAGQFDVADLTT